MLDKQQSALRENDRLQFRRNTMRHLVLAKRWNKLLNIQKYASYSDVFGTEDE